MKIHCTVVEVHQCCQRERRPACYDQSTFPTGACIPRMVCPALAILLIGSQSAGDESKAQRGAREESQVGCSLRLFVLATNYSEKRFVYFETVAWTLERSEETLMLMGVGSRGRSKIEVESPAIKKREGFVRIWRTTRCGNELTWEDYEWSMLEERDPRALTPEQF